MSNLKSGGLEKSAERLLADVGSLAANGKGGRARDPNDIAALVSADLVTLGPDGKLVITATGRAHLVRAEAAENGGKLDPFLAQHLALAHREIDTATGPTEVAVNDAESPLVWLARRKGRDGQPLIEPIELQAGERLRAEFTRAQLMPRVTSNWDAAVADGRRGAGPASFAEATVSARQRVRHTLESVGPEFSGLLLDVCCFLKRLADVEQERAWPPRSAKIVLQLALGRLARHYGFSAEIRGYAHASIRTWAATDAAFLLRDE